MFWAPRKIGASQDVSVATVGRGIKNLHLKSLEQKGEALKSSCRCRWNMPRKSNKLPLLQFAGPVWSALTFQAFMSAGAPCSCVLLPS
eukprot:1137390-Pelagomonas_calceolata.AAC.2